MTTTHQMSMDAALSMEPLVSSIQGRVLLYVQSCGAAGATCDEAEAYLDGRHQSISVRVLELRRAGKLVDSGATRRTRSGRLAVVWVAVPVQGEQTF